MFGRNTQNNTPFDPWLCMQLFPNVAQAIFIKSIGNPLMSFTHELQKEFEKRHPAKTCATQKKERAKLTVLLKTYNESFFLREWLEYYDKLIGLENVLVLDHESTDPSVQSIYSEYADKVRIVRVPHTINHDFLHNTNDFKSLYDFIKSRSDYFVLLDTDEFLCRFDGEKITSHGVIEVLDTYSDLQNISATWLVNYFTGTDTKQPSESTDFTFQDQHFRHNIFTGKTLFRYDTNQVIIGHNRVTQNLNVVPDLFILHVKRGNLRVRFETQKNACITFGFITEHDDTETIITKLHAVPENKMRHCVKEVLSYLENKEGHYKTMTDHDPSACIHTNVIAHTLYDEPLQYSVQKHGTANLHDAVHEHFTHIQERFTNKAVFIPHRHS